MLNQSNKTKTYFIRYLNEQGCPEKDKKSNGGRIPDWANYGRWLKNNDPVAFAEQYNSWKMVSKSKPTFAY
jgi:hypothetical protein